MSIDNRAPVPVRRVIGNNIKRIRDLRKLTVRDLAARLKEVGLSLSASGVSEVENASRKVTADELLVFAIVLNGSVIDLLTPAGGEDLEVIAGVEPIPAWAVESWLSGLDPWPPNADAEQFFEVASEVRKMKHRNWRRPELIELSALQSAILGAIEGPGMLNEVDDPKQMAKYLRDQADRVSQYVGLLAHHIETHGYGG